MNTLPHILAHIAAANRPRSHGAVLAGEIARLRAENAGLRATATSAYDAGYSAARHDAAIIAPEHAAEIGALTVDAWMLEPGRFVEGVGEDVAAMLRRAAAALTPRPRATPQPSDA